MTQYEQDRCKHEAISNDKEDCSINNTSITNKNIYRLLA